MFSKVGGAGRGPPRLHTSENKKSVQARLLSRPYTDFHTLETGYVKMQGITREDTAKTVNTNLYSRAVSYIISIVVRRYAVVYGG